ncbi:phosphomannomutase [Babesia caballi]|uniref:Phosphomannomutase n=1 Tax=Babesia caballi TaxID=5871 RepID=A0AAV4LSP6_BABCB|nr:phosphomannomutase [Babesia caballi]
MSRRILIFDMDGTLTPPVQPLTEDVKEVLLKCKERGYDLAVASGSNYSSICRQIGKDFINTFDYIFSENGTQVYREGVLTVSLDILDVVEEKTLKDLVEFSLMYIAQLDIPVKRGTFIEHRKSLINLCPVGRNCSDKERQQFVEIDKERNIRGQFMEELRKRFGNTDMPLRFSAGGQISIDVFPKVGKAPVECIFKVETVNVGAVYVFVLTHQTDCAQLWDKSITLTNLPAYEEIHFFGDKTQEGGNDYEICHHPDVIGHTVTNYKDLLNQLAHML